MTHKIKISRACLIIIVMITNACLSSNKLNAQASAQDIMNSIYQKYDSLAYISFDVKYIYTTDTLYGDFQNEVLDGSYTMAGKKAKYNLGDVEFMQNDSELISVYKRDRSIFVTDPRSANTGSQLPLRDIADSLLASYSTQYSISTDLDSTSGSVTFLRADSTAQFDRFSVSYDTASRFLAAVEYRFPEKDLINADDTTGAPPKYAWRHKTLRVEFSNYRMDNFAPDNYIENNYIWFDEGQYKPVTKYSDYKVYYSRSLYPSRTEPVRSNNTN